MNAILITAFWGSLGCLFYSYVAYPCLVATIARWVRITFRRPHRQATVNNLNEILEPVGESPSSNARLPSLTVLIAAHNAAPYIASRIRNLLACDYPLERLQIVVASDGSQDDTVGLVMAFNDPRIRVLDFPRRRGKAATLVEAVASLTTELVVFTDATTRFERDAIERLARHFVNPDVGLVTGHVKIIDHVGRPVESLYWQSEMMIRRCEAQLGIMLGASGAIYALRRRLFVPPHRPVINDDLVFPTLAQIRNNCQFVLDDSAIAYATSGDGFRAEFRRRCRIGAGAIQCVPALCELFSCRHATKLLAFFSHKLMRWVCPVWLIVLLAANIALAGVPLYRLLLWLQISVYLLAIGGLFARGEAAPARLARLATSFFVMNLALLAGLIQWLLSPNNVLWTPTQRPQSHN